MYVWVLRKRTCVSLCVPKGAMKPIGVGKGAPGAADWMREKVPKGWRVSSGRGTHSSCQAWTG